MSTITNYADLRALPVGTVFDYRHPDIRRDGMPRYWDYVVEPEGIRERAHETGVGRLLYSWDQIERNGIFSHFDYIAVDAPADAPAPAPETVTISREEYERLQREATREFSRYDERLRPMFVNAARIATAADFCHEYDRIANAVGAPSRDELFVKQFNHCVTVTVEFHIDATGDSDPDWDNAEILTMVNDQLGTNIGDGDIGYLSWDITESEDAGYLDPETGELHEL